MESNFSEENNKTYQGDFFISSIVASIIVLFFIVLYQNAPNHDLSKNEELLNKPDPVQLFENLDLEAQALFIWDVSNQEEIYSKNKESQLPLASLSKIVMALVALDSLPEGTTITISEEDLNEEGDSGLFAGEKWILKDLIGFSLMVSSNDGSMAIASAVGSQIDEDFVSYMNRKSKEIGLIQTYFTNPSGLDKEDIIPGGIGSARDMSVLFEYALKEFPEILEFTAYDLLEFNSADSLLHEAKNTNSLVSKLPGIIASKTGFTDLAGGNLVVVFEPEPVRPIIIIVLGSSLDGRFEDIEKLYLTTLEYINN